MPPSGFPQVLFGHELFGARFSPVYTSCQLDPVHKFPANSFDSSSTFNSSFAQFQKILAFKRTRLHAGNNSDAHRCR